MPELVESLERINYVLEREYGKPFDNRPEWRVVWSEDQFENRLTKFTDEGIELINPEVRYVPKYQNITERYILERLVPVVGETDLVTKTSYEPAWTFEDRFGNYLPPRLDACKFVIDAILGQMDKANTHKKYKDPAAEPNYLRSKVDKMEQELFGNETPVTDALTYGYGVAGFHSKMKENENGSGS